MKAELIENSLNFAIPYNLANFKRSIMSLHHANYFNHIPLNYL